MKKIILVLFVLILLTLLVFLAWPRDETREDDRLDNLTGNLMINNPGLDQGEWYLSHEAPGSPGLSVQLILDDDLECLGSEDFCNLFLEYSEDLAGERVKVKGERRGEYFDILWIEFLGDV